MSSMTDIAQRRLLSTTTAGSDFDTARSRHCRPGTSVLASMRRKQTCAPSMTISRGVRPVRSATVLAAPRRMSSFAACGLCHTALMLHRANDSQWC